MSTVKLCAVFCTILSYYFSRRSGLGKLGPVQKKFWWSCPVLKDLNSLGLLAHFTGVNGRIDLIFTGAVLELPAK